VEEWNDGRTEGWNRERRNDGRMEGWMWKAVPIIPLFQYSILPIFLNEDG
jgi:hypothetical protein